ncbi:MAG: GH92 family glycosyl hydrolase [Crocinitomicaceae bacterium]|nr:GH92 family glycosyl hydrolase [Crocinitomicaceae bacterium]
MKFILKNPIHLLLLLTTLAQSCSSEKSESSESEQSNKEYIQESPVDLVNPFIGTGGHGHTYPGATMPFGMVQLSPDTRLDGWDGCGGYHYSDSIIFGFSHTHLSGTGVSDYGDVLLTPFNLDYIPAYQELMDHSKTKSRFDKTSEIANPGYYSVTLKDFQINASLTATERVGIHQYIFENPKNRMIAINLNHRDKVLDCGFKMMDDSTIVGTRISEAWATEQHVYFAIRFSEPFKLEYPSGQATVKDLFRIAVFEENEHPIRVEVGLSATSEEGALKNLKYEARFNTFEEYVAQARATWEQQLDKVKVKGTYRDQLVNFYSALYHTMIAPNVFSDVDGHYRGMDQKVHYNIPEEKMYTVFSLWDTFRGLHPLLALIDRNKNTEFVKTFLRQYQEGGALPVWELAGNETGCMIGYHAVPVIVDHAAKGGNHEFDRKKALEAMIHSAEMDHLGQPAFREKGYIAAGDEAESVSKTLEYAYDDWCIAEFADGNKEIYNKYIERAQYYKNLFNPETGFMQSKMNGAFAPNFDPSEVNFNFTEANSWQYSMFVPQDIEGMIELYGGPDKFEKKLDELFSTKMELSGRHQVDITGLIGQYAHGNEPSHHMAYLYNFVGKPWKTQEKVAQILNEQYWNGPDGLSGNEDCGQMSAWYVLSAMGFYSVTPGSQELIIGSPLFDEITFTAYKKPFTIKAIGRSDSKDNIYIQSATLNGEEYNKNYIHYMDFFEGGELVLQMGNTPNKEWGSEKNSLPHSSIPAEDRIVPVPFSTVAQQTFEESANIELKSVCKDCEIYVSQNGGEFEKYSEPISITETTEFKYYGQKGTKKSKLVTSKYQKIEGGRSVIYESEYSNQYAAGGDKALVDYLRGSPNFRTGYWQGFQGQTVTFIVDLGEIKAFNKVKVGVLQDIKSWVWYPKEMRISVANSPKGHFKESGRVANTFSRKEYGAFTQEMGRNYPLPIYARYVKIELEYPGDCPDWHLGNGGKAWVFVDEVVIE